MGYRDHLGEAEAIELIANAIFEAADEDSATGGPDLIRDVYPIIAKITVDGYEAIADEGIADVFNAIINDRRSKVVGGE